MLIVRPNSMPRFWWLFPWSYARQLHRNCNALKALSDKQDDLLRLQAITRQRWELMPHVVSEGKTVYYFNDYHPSRGKCLLYDGPSKSFVCETDPAKAIERVTDLNK